MTTRTHLMARQTSRPCPSCCGSGCRDCAWTGAAGAVADGVLARRLPAPVEPCPSCNGRTLVETMRGPVPCSNPLCDDGAVPSQGASI